MRPIPVLVSLALSFTLAAADGPNRIEVPRLKYAPAIDGRVLPGGKPSKTNLGEWRSAAKVSLGHGNYAMLQHDGQFLYIGFVGAKPGIASICMRGKSGVRVLHASAALGTATYEQDKARKWKLSSGFNWTNREAPTSPEYAAARAKTVAAEGWFATTSPAATPEREYAIALTPGQTELPIVLGFLTFTRKEQGFSYWPIDLEDDCADADLASGFTEREYTFDPSKWGVAVLKQ